MTVLILTVASSPWGDAYRHLWDTPVRIGMGRQNLEMSLHAWVNEGLMALFFLLVGAVSGGFDCYSPVVFALTK